MQIAKKVITGSTVTFQWADGESTSVDVKQFAKEVRDHATAHGFSQKLGDSYSGAKTVAEARAAFNAVLEALKGGDWNRKGGATGGIIILAIAKATGQDVEAVIAKWDAMDEETRKSIKEHPDVVEAKAAIELERAQAKAAAKREGESVEPLKL